MSFSARPCRIPATLLTVVAVVAGACDLQSPGLTVGAAELEVDYAGCSGAHRGPVCRLEAEDKLVLWVPETFGDTELLIDGAEHPWFEGKAVGGGIRYQLALPEGSTRVTVVRPQTEERWDLTIEALATPPWLQEVTAHFSQGEFDRAEEFLNETLVDVHDPGERGRILAFLGQLATRRGDPDSGQERLLASLPLLRTADLKVEADQTAALVHSLIVQRSSFSEARTLLEALPADWREPAEVGFLRSYYAGVLATVTGDVRGALAHLERAVGIAERSGQTRLGMTAEQMVAVQLQRLGRHDEAQQVLEGLLTAPEGELACWRTGLLANLGWNSLNRRGANVERSLEILRKAQTLLEQHCPSDLNQLQNLLSSVALAELDLGRPKPARRALERATSLATDPGLQRRLWWQEIDARLALAEGRSGDAISAFERTQELAESAILPEMEWRATVGIARSRAHTNDVAGALEAFRLAEQQLESELLMVPLQEGRESLLAQRESATADHLDLLIREGRGSRALNVARRARVRLLEQLDRSLRIQALGPQERTSWDRFVGGFRKQSEAMSQAAAQDWQLAADALGSTREQRQAERAELSRTLDRAVAALAPTYDVDAPYPSPKPGVLELTFQPLPDGWAVFAQRDESLKAVTPECSTQLDELAECLLRAVATEIDTAQKLHIQASGSLGGYDFHAALLDGEALVAHAPIIYSLGLPEGDRRETPDDNAPTRGSRLPSTVLVLADARDDLPRARDEARSVVRTLREVATTKVLMGQDATSRQVASAISEAELLHLAGHAEFAGRGGWRTELPLAKGSSLSIEDVLVLEQVPRWVVLSGCETAREDFTYFAAEALNLAHAFLLAGSEGALAAVRPVNDELAAQLSHLYYDAWLEGLEPPEALRRAQLSLMRTKPESDWSSFRWIER